MCLCVSIREEEQIPSKAKLSISSERGQRKTNQAEMDFQLNTAEKFCLKTEDVKMTELILNICMREEEEISPVLFGKTERKIIWKTIRF